MKILITGANGYIAKTLIEDLSEYEIIAKTRQELDISDKEQVDKFFNENEVDYVIHTATKGGKRIDVDSEYIYNINMDMFENLVSHSNKYKKMFVFGSGAERTLKPIFYGTSKKDISLRAADFDNIIVLRIYGCFGRYEEPQRFFKNNITKYISKDVMEIHSNVKMDLFYDGDLSRIIKLYIEDQIQHPQLDLVYSKKYRLGELADKINQLDDYKIPMVIGGSNGNDYVSYFKLPQEIEGQLIGLEGGMKIMYSLLKEQYDN